MMKNLLIVLLGSANDRQALIDAGFLELLDVLCVKHEEYVFSAHRHPDQLKNFIEDRLRHGVNLFVGIAGMAADLPKAIPAHARGKAMAFGVPLPCLPEDPTGEHALMSIVLSPGGIPVSVQGIGKTGLKNTALQVAQVIAMTDAGISMNLLGWHQNKTPACGRLDAKTGNVTPL